MTPGTHRRGVLRRDELGWQLELTGADPVVIGPAELSRTEAEERTLELLRWDEDE